MRKKLIFLPVLAAAILFLAGCRLTDDFTGADGEDRAPGISAAGEKDIPGFPGNDPGFRVVKGSKGIILPQPRKKWTVLVYMDGDNNLSPYSTLDIKEMAKSGSTDAVNIVVLWDNDPSQDDPGAAERHGYYYVQKGSALLLKNAGEVDMGSPKTAEDFIDYAAVNFPAERVMWVYWNHGGAVDRAARGVCWDDTNGGTHLSETDQEAIMRHLKAKIGRKIDVVGFDACLMATAEIAYQYRDLASYLVASEQTIPGEGWDYTFLEKLKASPSMTARTLSKTILDHYKAFYSDEEDATFSVYNLDYASSLGKVLSDFASAALKGGTSTKSLYKPLSRGLPMFGVYSAGMKECYYTKDLYSYFKKVKGSASIPKTVRDRAAAAMDIISGKKLIPWEWHGEEWKNEASGIAVTLKRATDVYRRLDLCTSTQWDEFLNWAGFPDNDYVY